MGSNGFGWVGGLDSKVLARQIEIRRGGGQSFAGELAGPTS